MSDKKQFTLFPKLPPELQVMVWELTASVPRVLKMTSEKLHPTECRRSITNYTINSPHQIPPILQATSASRQVALKRYTPAFSFNLGHPVYFNFACDILHYTSSLMAGHCDDISKVIKNVEYDVKKVEKLMVEKDYLSPIYTLREGAALFPRLKTVVLEYGGTSIAIIDLTSEGIITPLLIGRKTRRKNWWWSGLQWDRRGWRKSRI